MLKKLLVPLDGSLLAQRALTTAVALVEGVEDHELILLRVVDDSNSSLKPSQSEKIRHHEIKQYKNYLKATRQSLMDHDVVIRPLVLVGDPASVIVDTAVAKEVDLIVMSTHGRSGLLRWMFGSVAEKVLQAVPCPILTVRSDKIPTNILITLDGSMIASQSLKPGLKVAERLQAKTTFLRVLESLEEIEGEVKPQKSTKTYFHRFQFLKVLNRLARHDLTEGISKYEEEGLSTQFALKEGKPAEGILDYAHNHNIDLIVMTTHGETGSDRWEYGSVTEKVRLKAKCAMLIIRPTFY